MSKKQNVATTSTGAPINKKPLGTRIKNNLGYYLMFLPVLVFVIIIYYWPMLGVRYAFYEYKLRNINWVGLKNFQTMFAKKEFWTAFSNTLQISITKLLITTFASVFVLGRCCRNFPVVLIKIINRICK